MSNKKTIKKMDKGLMQVNQRKRERVHKIMSDYPMWKAMMYIAWPGIFAAIIAGSYSFIDSVFLIHFVNTAQQPQGKVRVAVGLVNPLIGIMNAFVSLATVGASVKFSMFLGKKDQKACDTIAANGLVLSLFFGAVLSLMTYFTALLLPIIYGEHDSVLNSMMMDYIKFFIVFYIFLMLNNYFSLMLRSDGKGLQGALCLMIPALLNILLDWVFLGPLNMGMQGSNLASGISWVVGTIIGASFYFYNINKSNLLINFKNAKFNKFWFYSILTLGVTPFIRNGGVAITFFFFNFCVTKLPLLDNTIKLQDGSGQYNWFTPGSDPDATAAAHNYWLSAYAGISPLIGLLWSPMPGISQAGRTIMGYNYGADNSKRFVSSMKTTFIWYIVYLLFISIIMFAVGKYTLGLFAVTNGAHYDVIYKGTPYHFIYPHLLDDATFIMRIQFSMYVFLSTSFILMTSYLALGKAAKSVFFALLRSFTVFLPMVFIFWGISLATNNPWVFWFTLPTTEVVAAIISIPILIYQFKNIKNNGFDIKLKSEDK